MLAPSGYVRKYQLAPPHPNPYPVNVPAEHRKNRLLTSTDKFQAALDPDYASHLEPSSFDWLSALVGSSMLE
jgi:hypothetical protein